MIKTILSKLLMVLYFVVGALILEVVTFHLLELGFLPEYFGFNLAIIFAVALLVFVIPNYTAQYVIYTIILLAQTILIYVNYSLFVIYGDLFSIDMIHLGGEAMTAMTENFIYFSVIFQLIGVFLAISIVGAMLLKLSKKEKMNIKYHFSIFNVIIILAVQFFAIGYYVNLRNDINHNASAENANYIYSDAFLMNTSFLKRSSYAKYGSYGYLTNALFNGASDYNSAFKKSAIDYFDTGHIYDGTYYNVDKEVCSNGMFGRAEGQNVIVIMMESIEWFAFADGTYDYELENLSSELTPNMYNLIHSDSTMISSNFFAKSKTNFSESFGTVGLYPVGKSLADIVNGQDSPMDTFGYSMPSVMKENGYTTSYIHSNEIAFYKRNETHESIGFDKVIGKDGVEVNGEYVYTGEDLEWNNWEAEGDFALNAMDYIVPSTYKEQNFYSFYLNVSSHGPYEYHAQDQDCTRYIHYVMYGEDDCYWDAEHEVWKLKDTTGCSYDYTHHVWRKGEDSTLTYTEWYGNVVDLYGETDPDLCNELIFYQCGVKGLDDAIGAIINQLKTYKYDNGDSLYDNTTLLLYSDHYAYYDGLTNRVKGFDITDVSSIELNTIPMLIHSSAIKEYADERYPDRPNIYLENDRFANAYDVIPTLLDMLGIEFNENLYIGHSLFRPADNIYYVDGEPRDMTIYYSNTGGIFSEHVYTFDMREFYTTNDELDSGAVEIFKLESAKTLIKINYLSILNDYGLYGKLTNK